MSAAGAAAAMLRVGRLGRAHGLKGEVHFKPDEPGSRTLLTQPRLFLGTPPAPLRLLEARPMGDGLLLRLEGVGDRTAAERLTGSEVFLPREVLPATEPGEYFAADLVGLLARTPSGETLGRVVAVGGAGEVAVLEIEGARSWQVPLAEVFVKKVDLQAGEILVEPPEEE